MDKVLGYELNSKSKYKRFEFRLNEKTIFKFDFSECVTKNDFLKVVKFSTVGSALDCFNLIQNCLRNGLENPEDIYEFLTTFFYNRVNFGVTA
jgi:hypothetical protein